MYIVTRRYGCFGKASMLRSCAVKPSHACSVISATDSTSGRVHNSTLFSKRCAIVPTESSCSKILFNNWTEALKDSTTAVGDFWRCTVRCPLAPTSAASSKSCQPCCHHRVIPKYKSSHVSNTPSSYFVIPQSNLCASSENVQF